MTRSIITVEATRVMDETFENPMPMAYVNVEDVLTALFEQKPEDTVAWLIKNNWAKWESLAGGKLLPSPDAKVVLVRDDRKVKPQIRELFVWLDEFEPGNYEWMDSRGSAWKPEELCENFNFFMEIGKEGE